MDIHTHRAHLARLVSDNEGHCDQEVAWVIVLAGLESNEIVTASNLRDHRQTFELLEMLTRGRTERGVELAAGSAVVSPDGEIEEFVPDDLRDAGAWERCGEPDPIDGECGCALELGHTGPHQYNSMCPPRRKE